MILFIKLQNIYPAPGIRYRTDIQSTALYALGRVYYELKNKYSPRDPFSMDFHLHFDVCKVQMIYPINTYDIETILSIFSGVFSVAFKKMIFAERENITDWDNYIYVKALEIYTDEVSDRVSVPTLIPVPIKPFKEMPKEFREGTLLHYQ